MGVMFLLLTIRACGPLENVADTPLAVGGRRVCAARGGHGRYSRRRPWSHLVTYGTSVVLLCWPGIGSRSSATTQVERYTRFAMLRLGTQNPGREAGQVWVHAPCTRYGFHAASISRDNRDFSAKGTAAAKNYLHHEVGVTDYSAISAQRNRPYPLSLILSGPTGRRTTSPPQFPPRTAVSYRCYLVVSVPRAAWRLPAFEKQRHETFI